MEWIFLLDATPTSVWADELTAAGPWVLAIALGIAHKWRDTREKQMREGYQAVIELKDETIDKKDEEISEVQSRLEKNLIDEKKECNAMMREMTEALTNVHGSIQTMNALVSANNNLMVEVHGVLKDVKENR